MNGLRIQRLARVLGGACLVASCAATGPPLATSQTPHPAPTGAYAPPLILDRNDLRIGTTVHYPRIPSASELHDLQFVTGLAHVVLSLASWPGSYAELEALRQLPPETDLIVVLHGYPPSRQAAEAWNLLDARQRLVMIVEGPPLSVSASGDLNAMRGLERVVVQSAEPSRTGFERLQRPLSFRVIRN